MNRSQVEVSRVQGSQGQVQRYTNHSAQMGCLPCPKSLVHLCARTHARVFHMGVSLDHNLQAVFFPLMMPSSAYFPLPRSVSGWMLVLSLRNGRGKFRSGEVPAASDD